MIQWIKLLDHDSMVVQVSDGSLINVEIQRIGYEFPSDRCFCYGADLLLRQYDMVCEEQGKKSSYQAIRPIYLIVLLKKQDISSNA